MCVCVCGGMGGNEHKKRSSSIGVFQYISIHTRVITSAAASEGAHARIRQLGLSFIRANMAAMTVLVLPWKY